MVFIIFSSVLLTMAAGAAVDSAAKPKYRVPPDYPASCMAQASEDRPERVTVAYVINSDGRTEGARVRETTNACFNETAIAAVRSWVFEPRKIDGRAATQEDVEAALSFQLKAPTKMFDFDARPLVQPVKGYPQHCLRRTASNETVLIQLDVTVNGTTENIRAIDATNDCLVKSAEEAAADWKYTPMIVDGAPMARKGVQTLVRYRIDGGRDGVRIDRVRPHVWNAMRRVDRYLGRDGDPRKAKEELARIDAKYGAGFTRTERGAFHQLRAGARIDEKDYAGALDDLRFAHRLGAQVEDQGKLVKLIAELEAYVAAQGPVLKPAPAAAATEAAPELAAQDDDSE